MDISTIFEAAWQNFADDYKNSRPSSLEKGGGIPSPVYLSEADIQHRLASLLETKLAEEGLSDQFSVHLEVIVGHRQGNPRSVIRLDIVVVDREQAKEKVDDEGGKWARCATFAAIAEIAVIINKSDKDETYGFGKIDKNVNTLAEFKRGSTASKKGRADWYVVCVLDKTGSKKKMEEKKDKAKKDGVEILLIYDE